MPIARASGRGNSCKPRTSSHTTAYSRRWRMNEGRFHRTRACNRLQYGQFCVTSARLSHSFAERLLQWLLAEQTKVEERHEEILFVGRHRRSFRRERMQGQYARKS